jgi:hypothetical protein
VIIDTETFRANASEQASRCFAFLLTATSDESYRFWRDAFIVFAEMANDYRNL